MTDEEYVAGLMAKRNGFEQRLIDIQASSVPERVKQYRIRLLSKEMHALREEIEAAIVAHAKTERGIVMTLHTKLSYIKSIFRIVGYISLVWSITAGVVILVAAEGLGIAEEAWPGAYKGTETESQ